MIQTTKISAKSRKLLTEVLYLLYNEHPHAAIPKGGFDMNHWRAEKECGTVGCALGWAVMLLPSFRKLFCFDGVNGLLTRDISVDSNHEAMGLTHDQFEYLFQSDQYEPNVITQRMVARRIEKFLEDGKIKLIPNEI